MEDTQKLRQWKDHQTKRVGTKARLAKKALDGALARTTKKAKAAAVSAAAGKKPPATTWLGAASDRELGKHLAAVKADLTDCERCKLCETRTNIVFGEGNPKARLMFVGEGPGRTEDELGRPFVGRAGKLLDKIIEAMGMTRADVFIANVVKCRPPENRVPEADEVATCSPFLMKQIQAIKPQVVVALGATALKNLFGDEAKISEMRGKFVEFQGTKLMPTFHPAYLLRNPPAKKFVWDDMKIVLKELAR